MSKTLPSVFISYAHDDEKHKQRVLEFSDKLITEGGLDCWIDRYVEGSSPERGWTSWMEEKIRTSDFVLVVASPDYLKRFNGEEVDGKGKGGKYESMVITQELFDSDSKNKKFYSVLFEKGDAKYIIGPLKPWNYFDLSNDGGYDGLYRLLTDQIKIVRPAIGKIKILDKSTSVVAVEVEETDAKIDNLQLLKIPELDKFTTGMKPGMKILQAFFVLPITKRFSIASELKLVEEGESYASSNADELSGKFLLRAKEKGLLSDLWTKLFNETIDPNPFKK